MTQESIPPDPSVPPPAVDPAVLPDNSTPAVPAAVEYQAAMRGPDGSYLGPTPDKDNRLWGMLCHLSALSGFVGIPVGNIIGPLIVWLIKKNEMPFVDDQGKECLNFHITTMLAVLVCIPLVCLAGVGVIAMIAIGICALVFTIIGAVKANSGVAYRYPWSIKFIK